MACELVGTSGKNDRSPKTSEPESYKSGGTIRDMSKLGDDTSRDVEEGVLAVSTSEGQVKEECEAEEGGEGAVADEMVRPLADPKRESKVARGVDSDPIL